MWVATAILGSAAIGAGSTIFGANRAASAQENAANQAIAYQQGNYNTTRGDLAAYRNLGAAASTELANNNYFTAPVNVDQQLQDPNSTARKAYDFTYTQGNKAVANSVAARGLGVSGAALKGAANFTTGLADNTYTNLFNMANTNQTNAYNRLKGLVDTGENASAQTGTIGQTAATGAGNAAIGAGNAGAAAANATGGAIANAGNNIGGYYAYKGLYGSGSGDTTNGMQPIFDAQSASTRAVV